MQALALLDRREGDIPAEIPAGAELSTAFVHGMALVALRDGDRTRALTLLRTQHDRMAELGSEGVAMARELADIVAGRQQTGSWWYARILVAEIAHLDAAERADPG